MNAKIFVSSSCCISELYHYKSIGVLDKQIKFSENEIYRDRTELPNEAFFARCRNDGKASPEILEMSYEKLDALVKEALGDGYDKIIFILNENDDELLKLVIDDYYEKNKTLPIEHIVTKLYLYPLAYTVRNVDMMLKHEKTVEEVREYIHNVEDSFRIYFLKPEEEILPGINKFDYDEDILDVKRGILLDGTKNGILPLKKYKNNYPVHYLVDAYLAETANHKCKKFIIYTEKYSEYIRVLKSKLMPDDEIDMVSLSPYYAKQLGYTVVCFGFIIEA